MPEPRDPALDTAQAPGRDPGRANEYEQERVPAREGEPPRPAQEPPGSEGSSNSGETATDPATGKPNP